MLYDLNVADRSLPRTGAEELAAGSDLSAGRKDGLVVDIVRGEEAVAFAGAVVEFSGDQLALRLGQTGEAGAFGEVLTDESVGVFVGAALPSVMWISEVDLGPEEPLDIFEAMELGAVIGGDAMHWVQLAEQQPDRTARGFLSGCARQFGDADETALTLHQRQDAGFALPMHGVSFPVAAPQSLRHNFRSDSDHGFTGEPAPTVLPAVTFAPLLASASQMPPQGSVPALVRPDVKIDRFVAHDRSSVPLKHPHDLFGADLLPQVLFHCRKVGLPVSAVTARAASPAVGHLDRERRSVRSVIGRRIALHLPRNRARMARQLRGDLPCRTPRLPQRRDLISFLRTQLMITHRLEVSHLLPESKRPNKAPEPTPVAVMPRAMSRVTEVKLRNQTLSEARVTPATGVAHL